MDKEVLRKKYIDIRKKVENKVRKSEIVCQKVLATEEYKKSKIIACYKSLPTEVDTRLLIEEAINNGKMIVLPKVNGQELEFYIVKNLDNNSFEKSTIGVEEPKEYYQYRAEEGDEEQWNVEPFELPSIFPSEKGEA